MSKGLKTLFGVHAVVALLFGGPLRVAPGRVLVWLGWAPIDPVMSRVLGAALLALAWSSFRGWQTAAQRDVRVLVEMEAVFAVLGCVGLLRHLLVGRWPVPWATIQLTVNSIYSEQRRWSLAPARMPGL